jgi:hypothetical protein
MYSTGSVDTIRQHETATLNAVQLIATVANQVFLVTVFAAAEMLETPFAEKFGSNCCLRLLITILGAF